jgi:glycosyltransferase involved in cell wall biosynthesis
MRILMMAPHATAPGPVPGIVSALATALRSRGHEVQTTTWGGGVGAARHGSRVLARLQDVHAAVRSARDFSSDVVVVHTAHNDGAFYRDAVLELAFRLRRIPFAVEFHGSDPERVLAHPHGRAAYISRRIARGACGVLLLSTAEASAWRRFEPRGRYHVVENPYEPPVGGRSEAPGSAPTLRLVFAGRHVPGKGLLTTVEALGRVTDPSAYSLDIFGEGPERDAAVVAAGSAPVPIIVHGYVTRDEVVAHMREADVFVLPTSWPEGFPTVIAEAMGAGMAIVTTRHRGSADHLAEGKNALFVPAADPGELARALDRLAADRALVARMGAANVVAAGAFEPAAVAERYEAVLESCVRAEEGRDA